MAVPIDGLTTDQLLRGQRAATTRIRAAVLAYAAATWAGLGSWSDSDVEQFMAAMVPTVEGGQRQVAALTAAFLAQHAAQALGQPVAAASPDMRSVAGAAARNGVPPTTVYLRPFTETWTALSKGVQFEQAVKRGGERLASIVSTDLQRTKALTVREVLPRYRSTGYRRVPSGENTCALCWVASTQAYHKRDLMPIHPGCNCDVDPFYDDNATHRGDKATLIQTHDAVKQQFGFSDPGGRKIDYRKLVVVREHGELGPVLTVKGHRFTGPEAVKSGLDLADLPRI